MNVATAYQPQEELADLTSSWQSPLRSRVSLPNEVRHRGSRDERSNIVPDLIRTYWYRIGRSSLPERVFDSILNASLLRSGTASVAEGALSNFLGFWNAIKQESAEPVVSIAPNGSIVAEWFSTPDDSLAMMFDSDGKIHFSVFRQGLPLEGVRPSSQAEQAIAAIKTVDINPFLWSDANHV